MAIRRGDVTWHAFPSNGEAEMYSEELFQASLSLTFALDDHYGHARRKTLSLRDVPGLTRAVIPLLHRNNVTGVSVGQNSQCAPANVPPIFRWVDNATNTDVIALFHAFGYGVSAQGADSDAVTGDSSGPPAAAPLFQPLDFSCNLSTAEGAASSCADWPATVAYVDTNGNRVYKDTAYPYDDSGPGLHIDTAGRVAASPGWEHCVPVEAAGVAICYAWRVDNTGPQGYAEAEAIYDYVQAKYPGASVEGSDGFDDFMEAVAPYKDTLPVVTAEIGDTWMMGATSDPLKVALYRAASRAHSACVRAGGDTACVGTDPADVARLRTFERLLLNLGEHTWGWNGGDIRRKSWANEELAHSLATDTQFQTAVLTWLEQRSFIHNAVAALPATSPLAAAVRAEMALVGHEDQHFNATGMKDAPSLNATLSCGRLRLSFAPDGSIVQLQDSKGRAWADKEHALARVWYHNMDIEYFHAYASDYVAGPSAVWPDATGTRAPPPPPRGGTWFTLPRGFSLIPPLPPFFSLLCRPVF